MSRHLIPIVLALLCSACTDSAPRAAVFRPVVADAVRELERALPEPPPAPAPDAETTARVRARAESLAAELGPMRPLLAGSVNDFGDVATPVLAQMLGEASVPANVRVAAAELLGVLDTPAAAGVLVYHATSNPVSWVRAQCAWRLASTNQDQCVVPLLEALATERHGETRAYMGSTLARFGCTDFGTSGTEQEPSPRFVLAVWRRVATLREPAATHAALVEALGGLPASFAAQFSAALSDVDAGVRRGAALVLARMGPRAIAAGPALLASLLGDAALEVEATVALGAVHHTPAAPELEARLGDRARSVPARAAAARALGRLGAARYASALESAHAASEPAPVRLAAAGALCAIGRADAGFDTLVAGLRGADADVATSDAAFWLDGLERAGHVAAKTIRARLAAGGCSPEELASLLTAARAELVR